MTFSHMCLFFLFRVDVEGKKLRKADPTIPALVDSIAQKFQSQLLQYPVENTEEPRTASQLMTNSNTVNRKDLLQRSTKVSRSAITTRSKADNEIKFGIQETGSSNSRSEELKTLSLKSNEMKRSSLSSANMAGRPGRSAQKKNNNSSKKRSRSNNKKKNKSNDRRRRRMKKMRKRNRKAKNNKPTNTGEAKEKIKRSAEESSSTFVNSRVGSQERSNFRKVNNISAAAGLSQRLMRRKRKNNNNSSSRMHRLNGRKVIRTNSSSNSRRRRPMLAVNEDLTPHAEQLVMEDLESITNSPAPSNLTQELYLLSRQLQARKNEQRQEEDDSKDMASNNIRKSSTSRPGRREKGRRNRRRRGRKGAKKNKKNDIRNQRYPTEAQTGEGIVARTKSNNRNVLKQGGEENGNKASEGVDHTTPSTAEGSVETTTVQVVVMEEEGRRDRKHKELNKVGRVQLKQNATAEANKQEIKQRKLVFLQESPDYCLGDPTLGKDSISHVLSWQT